MSNHGWADLTRRRHVGASLWTARLYRLCGHEPGAILDTDTGLAAAAELRELRDIVAGVLDLIADRLETGDIMFGGRP